MATKSAPPDLQTALQGCCEKFNEPKQTVLFRRGEAAFGMFLVLKGKVSLDFGVDGSNPLNTSYGPGALVGLPATLTGHNYSMTATVTEDAEVGFISMKALLELLGSRPEFCQQLLTILSARVAQTDRIRKAMLAKENIPEHEVGLSLGIPGGG
jgi:CRP-like cAMP-binding protein